jgi:hypothetical protein
VLNLTPHEITIITAEGHIHVSAVWHGCEGRNPRNRYRRVPDNWRCDCAARKGQTNGHAPGRHGVPCFEHGTRSLPRPGRGLRPRFRENGNQERKGPCRGRDPARRSLSHYSKPAKAGFLLWGFQQVLIANRFAPGLWCANLQGKRPHGSKNLPPGCLVRPEGTAPSRP